jgi:hypothetical protein
VKSTEGVSNDLSFPLVRKSAKFEICSYGYILVECFFTDSPRLIEGTPLNLQSNCGLNQPTRHKTQSVRSDAVGDGGVLRSYAVPNPLNRAGPC